MRLTQQDLDHILDLHKKWLDDEEGGVQANLAYADASGLDFSFKDLSKAYLWNTLLEGAWCISTIFCSANLSNASFCAANLSGANLSQVDAMWVDFTRADCSHADFSHAKALGTNFSHAYCFNTNFEDAKFWDAQFLCADLTNAKFIKTYLGHSSFERSKLKNADFLEANVTSANFSYADLDGVDLNRAENYEAATENNTQDIRKYGISPKSIFDVMRGRAVIVPVDPTAEMVQAGYAGYCTDGEQDPFDHYHAMIAASPYARHKE